MEKKSNGKSPVEKSAATEGLEEFIRLMDEKNLQELEIADHGFHVKLVRQSREPMVMMRQTGHHAPHIKKGSPVVDVTPGKPVKSPLAGVFYRAPSPQADPYVKEGQVVAPETTLCIVEAMKVLNEIKSDFGGRVVKICIENGNPVQSGQILFYIDPT